MMKTTLLCTFTTEDKLEDTLGSIAKSYHVAFDSIYVLENLDVPGALCCTYNVEVGSDGINIPAATISIHRKKLTNTLYTINALNVLVRELNNDVFDRDFEIPWENYRNQILVTAYGKLKKIPTALREIVKIQDI